MKQEHAIVQQVYAARENIHLADELIGQYVPFIKAETAKFLKRPADGSEDEFSIAMMAFHEAILSYSSQRGAFLKYAAMLMQNRMIDYYRKEQRHRNILSLHAHEDEEDPLLETLADEVIHDEVVVMRDATRAEIEELSLQMSEFGVTLSDVTDHCPKQQRTLEACQKALWVVRENKTLMEDFLRTKRLPIGPMAEGSGTERKTLERHRKYLVALLLVYTNGYEIIRGHLKQVWKGGAAR